MDWAVAEYRALAAWLAGSTSGDLVGDAEGEVGVGAAADEEHPVDAQPAGYGLGRFSGSHFDQVRVEVVPAQEVAEGGGGVGDQPAPPVEEGGAFLAGEHLVVDLAGIPYPAWRPVPLT